MSKNQANKMGKESDLRTGASYADRVLFSISLGAIGLVVAGNNSCEGFLTDSYSLAGQASGVSTVAGTTSPSPTPSGSITPGTETPTPTPTEPTEVIPSPEGASVAESGLAPESYEGGIEPATPTKKADPRSTAIKNQAIPGSAAFGEPSAFAAVVKELQLKQDSTNTKKTPDKGQTGGTSTTTSGSAPTNWLGKQQPGSEGQLGVTDGTPNVEVTIDPSLSNGLDSDHDGLSDELEKQYGTDPTNPDTDGDGLLDGDEVNRGLNPLAVRTDGEHNDWSVPVEPTQQP